MEKKKNSKLPKWAIALIVLAFIISIVPVACIIALISFTGFDDIDKDLLVDRNITALYDEKSNSYVLTGKVSNNSDDDYSDIEIEYTFYDEDGNVIGVASDYLEELEDGKTWKFSVEYFGVGAKDIASYELTELEGF